MPEAGTTKMATRDIGILFSVRSYVRPSTFATTLASTVLSVTLNPYEIRLQGLVQIQSIIRQYGQNKYHNSAYIFLQNYALLQISIQYTNRISSITLRPFEIFSCNLAQLLNIIRQYTEIKYHNSIYSFFYRIMPLPKLRPP